MLDYFNYDIDTITGRWEDDDEGIQNVYRNQKNIDYVLLFRRYNDNVRTSVIVQRSTRVCTSIGMYMCRRRRHRAAVVVRF